MKKIHSTLAVTALLATSLSHAQGVFTSSFDSAAGEFQSISNGAGGSAGTGNENGGTLVTNNGNNNTAGLVATSAADVSGGTGFEITWTVASVTDFSLIGGNGLFLGVQSATGTTGSALWNNPTADAFGIALSDDVNGWRFAVMTSISGTETQYNDIAAPTATSVEDGFTVTLQLNSDGTFSGTTTGLSNSATFGTVTGSGLTGLYDTLDTSAYLVANTQNNASSSDPLHTVTLDSVSMSTIPEPSSLALFFGLGVMGFAATRRRR